MGGSDGWWELEEARTHKSAKTRPRQQCFYNSWPFELTINGFLGLIMEHFYVKFDDLGCIGFWDIVRKKADRHTDKQW